MIISKIQYAHGMLKHTHDRRRDYVVAFVGEEISDELVRVIEENDILGASGSYGDPRSGQPMEYDRLVITHDSGRTEIEFYNKGITVALGADEHDRRVFRVCAHLHQLAARGK